MQRITGSLSVLVLTVGCATSPKRPTVDLRSDDIVKKQLFTGANGLRIEFVELKNGKGLLRVEGGQGLLDRKVVLTQKVLHGNQAQSHHTLYHGSRVAVLFRWTRTGRWKFQGLEKKTVDIKPHPSRSAAIDARALLVKHAQQQKSGALSFQRYDRVYWKKQLGGLLAQNAARAKKACGVEWRPELDWSQIDDAIIKRRGWRLIRHCLRPLFTLVQTCKRSTVLARQRPEVQKLLARVKTLRLFPTRGGVKSTLVGSVLHHHCREPKQGHLLAVRWSKKSNETLGQLLEKATNDVCIQGKRQIVLRSRQQAACYGQGNSFRCSPRRYGTSYDIGRCLPFYDPRYVERGTFRLKWRSCIKVDLARKTCELRCGKRKKSLPLMTADDKARLLARARFAVSPFSRRPHALARDRRGIYYYVDRSSKKSLKDYRVFVGRRGRLIRQQMVDVVDDSEGQIFATKRGKLRLVVSKARGFWISRGQTRKLVMVPIKSNLPLIHRELGVYWGKRLDTPCDDF
jgi:hypothetical protein